MPGASQYKVAEFITAIPGSGGIIATIAKRVGCAWNTAKHYITTHPTVARAYADECEGITDLAESTVIKAIRDGDVNAAKWYLTMKAKDRGYTPRREITGPEGGPVAIDAVIDSATIEEALRILGSTGGCPGCGS